MTKTPFEWIQVIQTAIRQNWRLPDSGARTVTDEAAKAPEGLQTPGMGIVDESMRLSED